MRKKIVQDTFDYKQRLIGFGGLILFSLLIYFSIYIGYESITEYLSYPESFVFVSGMLVMLLIPLFFLPLIILSFPLIVNGKKASDKIQSLVAKCMIYSVIFILLATIGFKFIYQHTLNEKGYLVCKGIPTGYMPGFGKQYVKDIDLCE